jgi:hypothetical protein
MLQEKRDFGNERNKNEMRKNYNNHDDDVEN